MMNLKLGEILVNAGVLSEEDLKTALKKQKGSNKRLGEILIENNLLTEMQMISSLSKQFDIPYIDLSNIKINTGLSSLIPERFARENAVVPLKLDGTLLTVAIADPLDYNALNDLGAYTKYKIFPMIAERKKIEIKIQELYSKQKAYNAAKDLYETQQQLGEETPGQNDEISEASSQPVIRFVNTMIEQAVLAKASDIHIEPQEKRLLIRFRVDGHLSKYMETKASLASAVSSRIKFIGGMNIAEKRIPQDGRINYSINGKEIDLRISVLPCIFGEKVVIRITTPLGLEINKHSIGFLPENLEKFDRLIRETHGIILLTGPTGSGKSTTLYTALKDVQREDINIITVENPVEMIIPNITQVEVNEKAGLTFASVLRSILRQDPDVIMVGEIRDRETAEIATTAAITGHLVLSTLHTYDAASSVIRLIDMGVQPFMVSSALSGVIAQRLVRKLCTHCREEYYADESELKLLHMEPGSKIRLYKSHDGGCPYCGGKGYRGRTAIHEIMVVSDRIRQCINGNGTTEDIYGTALDEGMITLNENLIRIVLDGTTSVEEMVHMSSSSFN